VTHESQPPDSAPDSSPLSSRPEPEKKERVLHTRIPAVLEAELKATAAALRVPVSNLVRTILEDAVRIADRASEKVEDRLARAAAAVHDERDRLRARVSTDPLRDVVAYQKVTMAVDGRCARCRAELASGDEAQLAIFSRPGPAQFTCIECPEEKTS
jgi:hypothetical protein